LKERHVTGKRQVVQRAPDVLVHDSEIDGFGFRSLEENRQVEFEVTQGPNGPQATHVSAA
jgi:cold shock protein